MKKPQLALATFEITVGHQNSGNNPRCCCNEVKDQTCLMLGRSTSHLSTSGVSIEKQVLETVSDDGGRHSVSSETVLPSL